MIKKTTLIKEITDKYPQLAVILVQQYGFHCLGCWAAGEETLAEGALAHGYSPREIREMIAVLNKSLLSGKGDRK
ncbi:MAG TPA: DUF1858 domain-containing protein [Candidatus Woesebacteria bacterium]|nr:DUF1858 domain-containing protein [Candidatus Woesebacteria bacterium]HRS23091.1 DUF1858 domain-containing protein [Candidatus Woesebacteria bacterium]HRT40301.1 DUF1858 domain-containing protein [Candidatus Woesebacteria bacterium]